MSAILLNKDAAKKAFGDTIESLRKAFVENVDAGGDITPVVRDRMRDLSDVVKMTITALECEGRKTGK